MEIRKTARTVSKNTQKGNGGHAAIVVSVYFCSCSLYVCASAYPVMLRAALSVYLEKDKTQLQIQLKCEIIYTCRDHEQNL